MAEGVGTAFLLVAVVGSGIMAEALAQGNTALALLANAVATGCALLVLILTFAPISGAHFNPLVTLAATFKGHLRARDVPSYLVAQMAGAVVGVWLAHLMFDLPILQLSVHRRHGLGQWAGEIVATAGLFMVIESGERHFPKALSGAIAAYITAAYWFTSSTSFANPAVTVARSLSNSFAGIDPADILGFVLAQAVGAALAVTLFRWFDAAPRD
ncbi:MAG TPA: aquaporin [Stellaceae bacterium]|nr:aquaporin [Stellaceae bacterium]